LGEEHIQVNVWRKYKLRVEKHERMKERIREVRGEQLNVWGIDEALKFLKIKIKV